MPLQPAVVLATYVSSVQSSGVVAILSLVLTSPRVLKLGTFLRPQSSPHDECPRVLGDSEPFNLST